MRGPDVLATSLSVPRPGPDATTGIQQEHSVKRQRLRAKTPKVRESAVGTRQAAEATTQLSQKAEVLRSLADRFRLS